MGDLRVERNRTTVDLVQMRLREAIVSGRFPPGHHLREAELVAELGVSRTPIREALRRLEREKLVVNLPYRGVVVKEPSAEEAREIFQVRAVLEGLVARLAAQNRTPVIIADLEAALAEADAALAADDRASLTRAAQRFHNILYAAAGNAYLTQLLEEMRTHVALLRLQAWSLPERPRRTVEDHRRIYEAIAAAEPAAAEAAAVHHITLAWAAVRAAMAAGAPAGAP